MEAIFLKVLNMSITASYVILAVLLIRLVLKRAPKKYSYLLYIVVLFRLVCPVSFSFEFSIFQSKPFDMTMAQRSGEEMLSYVTPNIRYMENPRVTIGVPFMNSVISDSLPKATPYASVNPMQIWLAIGTIIWCTVIGALLIYSVISFLSIKHRMATSILLEGNIYESDKIRSPFIMGLIRPRIYIPFGLGEHERTYILLHEKFHLKRRDHLIKAIGFIVLVIHWFNPLVWLSFALMSKDMEMSCDEKVMAEVGVGMSRQYSMSLLSFAVNRRFPAASPLAFGENGIRERVKNILKFKKPKKWVVVLASILCATAAIACIANPRLGAKAKTMRDLTGNYVFEKQLYMNPLSSFLALGGYKEYYTLTDDMLVITYETGTRKELSIDLEQTKFDVKEFKNSFLKMDAANIDPYKIRQQITLADDSGYDIYRIYLLDNEIWLAKIHRSNNDDRKKENIWSIYKIRRFDGEIPYKTTISGNQEGVEKFLSLHKGFESGYANDVLFNITPEYIRENTGYSIFKDRSSCASFLLYEDIVYPLGEWFGGIGLASMALADLNNDQKPELYFTYSFGSGLHRSHAAYFDPVEKKVISFDYAHLNEDMILVNNAGRGLSLYSATLSRIESFVDYDIEKKDFISDIVYKAGKISLSTLANNK